MSCLIWQTFYTSLKAKKLGISDKFLKFNLESLFNIFFPIFTTNAYVWISESKFGVAGTQFWQQNSNIENYKNKQKKIRNKNFKDINGGIFCTLFCNLPKFSFTTGLVGQISFSLGIRRCHRSGYWIGCHFWITI